MSELFQMSSHCCLITSELNISNNQLYGKISPLESNVLVKTEGNINIGKYKGWHTHENYGKISSIRVVAGSVVSSVCVVIFFGN